MFSWVLLRFDIPRAIESHLEGLGWRLLLRDLLDNEWKLVRHVVVFPAIKTFCNVGIFSRLTSCILEGNWLGALWTVTGLDARFEGMLLAKLACDDIAELGVVSVGG